MIDHPRHCSRGVRTVAFRYEAAAAAVVVVAGGGGASDGGASRVGVRVCLVRLARM